jgi:hypothetical protein
LEMCSSRTTTASSRRPLLPALELLLLLSKLLGWNWFPICVSSGRNINRKKKRTQMKCLAYANAEHYCSHDFLASIYLSYPYFFELKKKKNKAFFFR